MDAIQIESFKFNNTIIQAVEPLIIPIKWEENEYIYYNIELALFTTNVSYANLIEDIKEELSFMWGEYALEKDEALDEEALELKNTLLKNFQQTR